MKKNIFTRIIAIALIAMSIMAIAIPAMAGSYTNAKVIGGRLNVRKTPSTSATIKGYLNTGDRITVEDYDSNAVWLKITSGTYSGYYVMRKFVDVTWCDNTTSSLLFGSSTLSQGSSGKYVYNLQHALNRFYANVGHSLITVDGSFGPNTEQAVKDYQGSYASSGIDGIFGSWTRGKLTNYITYHNTID